MLKQLKTLLLASLIFLTGNATATQRAVHVKWDRDPISFVIPVGQEKMLTFPSRVVVKGDQAPLLTTDKVTLLNNNGTLYIKALKAFSPIRVPVVVKATGAVVLIDLSAKVKADPTPVEVVLAESGTPSKKTKHAKKGSSSYISLLRYAIQHLYSPQRLIDENPTINRTPMYTTKDVALTPISNVIAMPLASWHSGSYYITAVLLKNVWHESVRIDPRRFSGHWLAASFYPSENLSAQGTRKDRTTVFLVSNRAFGKALSANKGYIQ